MSRLFGLIYTMTGSALAGSMVIAALVTGRVDARSIIVAAVLGALIGLPVAWFVAKRIADE